MGKSRRTSNNSNFNLKLEQNDYEEFTTENGKHTINIKETTDENEFLENLEIGKSNRPMSDKFRVYVPDKSELKGRKLYVTESGSTIAINKDGDIESVVVQGDDSGAALIEFAIQHGGTKLDSYDGNYGFYRHMGFEPVSYTPFNEEYVDKGWYNTQEKPREDVIFMVYGGKQAKPAKWDQTDELRRYKQTHPSQQDTYDPDTGEVQESGYDKAEQQRAQHFNRTSKDYNAIWAMEGLE